MVCGRLIFICLFISVFWMFFLDSLEVDRVLRQLRGVYGSVSEDLRG